MGYIRKEIDVYSCPGHAVNYDKESLLELVALGYGFGLERDGLIFQSQLEYKPADIVYFAKEEENEVGSLSVKIRSNSRNDPFWANLHTIVLDLTDSTLLACYIHGIVVHPEIRKEGIARKLLNSMIDDYSPVVVFGQSKTPEAVLVRARVLKDYGYRTFYGFCEVTPDSGLDREHEGANFVKAAIVSEGVEANESGIYYINNQIISAYLPNTDGFTPEIQRAFRPIQDTQSLVGGENTAVTVLVSVKASVFD